MLFLLLAACNITPIEDGATYGPLTQVKNVFTSVFVAETDDGVVTFDASLSKKARPIERYLEDEGLSLDEVEHVFVTHGHGDHVNGLAALPGAEVYGLEEETELVAEESEGSITRVVEDGEVLDIGGLRIEVFSVPGHTPGTAVYLVDDVLVTGDAAILQRDGTVATAPDRYDEDPEQAIESLSELRDQLETRGDVGSVVFSHSGGLDNPQPFWDFAE